MEAFQCPPRTPAEFRLLYLGNDLNFINAMQQALPEPVYELVTCGDRGTAGLFVESEIPYALMLIDLDWRGREGLELVRLARSLSFRKRMPIVLVAGELNGALRTAARRAGVNKSVTKTADMNKLSQTIRQLI